LDVLALPHAATPAADSAASTPRYLLLLSNIRLLSEWGAQTAWPQDMRTTALQHLHSMNVRVRLFAGLRQRAGRPELELELPDGARVADALERVRWLTGELPVVMAVNREYADPSVALHADDELALIPPVSGGSVSAVHARVVDAPLSLAALAELVADPRAGAVVTFSGVTREVPALEYEAYAEMAEREIAGIVAAALERHGLCSAAAEHRIGTVPLSEASVIVAASAPHRGEAFAGAREIIDEIKARAPIWKREEGEWKYDARPPEAPEAAPGR
jgi:molybdopterin synthase catalytic subunit